MECDLTVLNRFNELFHVDYTPLFDWMPADIRVVTVVLAVVLFVLAVKKAVIS